VAHESWDPTYWENHAVALITRHFGVDKVIRVPDADGGDRGLDAFTVDGVAYQCYAPENEPLAPKRRASLQKNKIHTDLKKLQDNASSLVPLLGDVRIHTWVLLTPVHESAGAIEYCNTKASEVVGWGLPFTQSPFRVQIHDLRTYQVEHAAITHLESFATDLAHPPSPPGIDFSVAAGPQITVMDDKLKKIPALSAALRRDQYRATLLEGQFQGDSLLDRFRTRIPDLATLVEGEIDAALRSLILGSISSAGPADYLTAVQTGLVNRFTTSIGKISLPNAEHLASKCLSDWLQQCPLDFEESV
jgi:hypothetical protein